MTVKHGTASSQFGLASCSLTNTSTITVPASTGLCIRVAVTKLLPVIVAGSRFTVCEE